MLVIDIAKTGQQNVVDLIVANNPTAAGITLANCSLGAVLDANDGDNNTTVTITAVLDAGYSGESTVTYYRPTLEQAATVPAAMIEVDTSLYDPEDPTAYEEAVKAAFVAALELRAEDFEIQGPIPVPTSENNPENVNLIPAAGSYIYSGGQFQVTFAAIDTDIPLASVITVTTLDGFTY